MASRDNAADPTQAAGRSDHKRLRMLDGWRAISILLVLAGHLLPLGPKSWGLNGPVAALGMVVFFNLSGFLIVSILLRDDHVGRFLLRRLARILPLAWLVLAIVFAVEQPSWPEMAAMFLFYANLPPFWLTYGPHFWSLGVEMQFYLGVAMTVLVLGRRGLFIVPLAALAVTGVRVATGTDISIVTWLRVDEILAGGTLAILIHYVPGSTFRRIMQPWALLLISPLFLLSTRELWLPLDYARPYLSAATIGLTIINPTLWVNRILEDRRLAYIARISYAVYIIHPYTTWGWLGSGPVYVKYAKRPICFALTFIGAHLSTFYYEKRFIDWSHRVTARHGQGGARAGAEPV